MKIYLLICIVVLQWLSEREKSDEVAIESINYIIEICNERIDNDSH